MIHIKEISKKKKIAGIGAIVVVIILTTVGVKAMKGKGDAQSAESMLPPVNAAMVEKMDLSKVVGVNGSVESENSSKITTSLTSTVKEVHVQPGDKVKEGDILCIFDDEAIKADIKSLEEQIANSNKSEAYQDGMNQRALDNAKTSAQRQLENAGDAVSQAQEELDRAGGHVGELEDNLRIMGDEIQSKQNELNDLSMKKLRIQDMGGASDEVISALEGEITACSEGLTAMEGQYSQLEAELEAARDAKRAAEKMLGEAGKGLESAQDAANQEVQGQVDNITMNKFKTGENSAETELEKLKKNLEDTVIKAPISGTVTYLNAEAGSTVDGGLVMKIENTDNIKITVKIKEYDILNIKEGMKVDITSDAMPETPMTGTVSKIFLTPITNASGTNEGGTLEYAAEIKLDSANQNLLIGMNVKTKIILEESKDVLAVPYDAITVNENGESIVYVAEEDGNGRYTVRSVPVQKGLETDYYAAVSGEGLTEGMLIITMPDMVTEGSTVDISITNGAVPMGDPGSEQAAPGAAVMVG